MKNPSYSSVNYKGVEYPTRIVPSPIFEDCVVTVGTESLLNAMEERYNELGTIEEKIDSQITFYVDTYELDLPTDQLLQIIEPDLTWLAGTLDFGSRNIVCAVTDGYTEEEALDKANSYSLTHILNINGFDSDEVTRALDFLGIDIDTFEFHTVIK